MTAPQRWSPRYQVPCTRFVDGRHCGATPTRRFLNGALCESHAPAQPPTFPTNPTPGGGAS